MTTLRTTLMKTPEKSEGGSDEGEGAPLYDWKPTSKGALVKDQQYHYDHNDDHDHDENDYEDDGVEADKKYEHIHHQPVERSRFQTQREWCRVCSFEQGHPPCLVMIRRMR